MSKSFRNFAIIWSTEDAYASYAPDLTSGISRGQCLPCTHFVLFFIYMYEIDQGSSSLPCFAMWSFIWTNLNSRLPENTWIKFGWHWTSGSGEDVKNVKSLQTDKEVQAIKKAHLCFQLRWAKKQNNLKTVEH